MIPDPTEREDGPGFTPGYAILLTVGAALGMTLLLALLASPTHGITPSRLGFSVLAAFSIMFAIATPRLPGPPARTLGFVRPPTRVWLAVGLLLPTILLVSEIDNVLRGLFGVVPEPVGELRPRTLPELLEMAFVFVLVVPVVEEVFFRGMIQPRLVAFWDLPRGLALASFLSALPMLTLRALADSPSSALTVLVTGFATALCLGWLRARTDSVLPGLALTVSYGVIGLLASFGTFGIGGFDDLDAAHTPLPWLVFAAGSTALGLRITPGLPAASRPRPESSP